MCVALWRSHKCLSDITLSSGERDERFFFQYSSQFYLHRGKLCDTLIFSTCATECKKKETSLGVLWQRTVSKHLYSSRLFRLWAFATAACHCAMCMHSLSACPAACRCCRGKRLTLQSPRSSALWSHRFVSVAWALGSESVKWLPGP